MLAKTFSAAPHGIDATVVEIEVARQLFTPKIIVTGLPSDVVKEGKERILVNLTNLGFDVPSSQLLVHLSPASSRKRGSHFDLAIALAVLSAEQMLVGKSIARSAFLGELSLDGRIQPVQGALALIEILERSKDIDEVFIPAANAREASIVGGKKVRLVNNLAEAIDYLGGKVELARVLPFRAEGGLCPAAGPTIDDVIGQFGAKRALQIAIAGRHHLLMIGAPGVGKSLLASCVPQLLGPLDPLELIEVAKIYGAYPGEIRNATDSRRPFRSPHHTISGGGLLGGGSGTVVPGEVTLAHRGVLFLDEFPEFRKDALEGLREPVQSGVIHLNRVGNALSLPGRFLLLAAMNPCPCGYAIGGTRKCSCPWDRVRAYRKRISGPILNRIDLAVVMAAVEKPDSFHGAFSHAAVRESIVRAHAIQRRRYASEDPRRLNGEANVDLAAEPFRLGEAETAWFEARIGGRELSYRSLHKLVRVARTIADLDGEPQIRMGHLREANQLRCPDNLVEQSL